MHHWGDQSVDWNGISTAAEFIALRLGWARIGVLDAKEKWGTVRVYCTFGWSSLHSIFYPRYHYIQWKNPILKWLEYNAQVMWTVQKLGRILVPLQRAWYRQVYKQAISRWPHLAEEITCCADYRELLEGLYEPNPPEPRG